MSKPRTTARCGLVTARAIAGTCPLDRAARVLGRLRRLHARTRRSTAGPRRSVAVNANQVRLRMRSLVGPMCGEIERTADQIAAGTTDPAVRRAALRWKIDAVPTLSAALFQPEPMTAVLDSWVFFNQMADFFETGVGREQLGDSAPVAVETSRRLEQRDRRRVRRHDGFGRRLHGCARSRRAGRPPTPSDTRSGTARRRSAVRWSGRCPSPGPRARRWRRSRPRSTTSTGSSTSTTITSSDRPGGKRSCVAADLRLADVPPLAERTVQSVESLAAAFDRIAPSFERVAAVAETTPGFVAAERKATIDDLGGELTRMITFLERERIVALRQVTEERIAAIGTSARRCPGAKGARARHRARRRRAGRPRRLASRAAPRRGPGLVLGVGTVGILSSSGSSSSRLRGPRGRARQQPPTPRRSRGGARTSPS